MFYHFTHLSSLEDINHTVEIVPFIAMYNRTKDIQRKSLNI